MIIGISLLISVLLNAILAIFLYCEKDDSYNLYIAVQHLDSENKKLQEHINKLNIDKNELISEINAYKNVKYKDNFDATLFVK